LSLLNAGISKTPFTVLLNPANRKILLIPC